MNTLYFFGAIAYLLVGIGFGLSSATEPEKMHPILRLIYFLVNVGWWLPIVLIVLGAQLGRNCYGD